MNLKTGSSSGEEPMETTPANGVAVTPRICIRPGCASELGRLNRSGRCSKHFHWQEPGKVLSAGNGHGSARSNGTNGHARAAVEGVEPKATNSTGAAKIDAPSLDPAGGFLEARLDRLLLNLPAADKSRIAQQWLRGEI
jgi:hypothetical protein